MMNEFVPKIPLLLSPNKVLCGFTTRNGGVSPAPFESLNCGFTTADTHDNILENTAIVYRHAGITAEHAARMGQVHGSEVKVVHSGGVYNHTDGLTTDKPGVILCVQVADCIPLLLHDPVHNAVGAIHCGWRPIAAGIAEKALEIMNEHYGTDPETVTASMGPAAGQCCYEVGDDVAGELHPGSLINRNGAIFADLKAELSRRLISVGLKENNLEISDDCTICTESLYYSYRRDGKNSGRMLGFIMVK